MKKLTLLILLLCLYLVTVAQTYKFTINRRDYYKKDMDSYGRNDNKVIDVKYITGNLVLDLDNGFIKLCEDSDVDLYKIQEIVYDKKNNRLIYNVGGDGYIIIYRDFIILDILSRNDFLLYTVKSSK